MPRPWPSHLSVSLSISGELDMMTAPALREELLALAQASTSPELVLDLSGVEFMDTSGLQPFIDAASAVRARGGRIRLVAVPPSVDRLIRALGLSDTFHVLDVAPSDGLRALTPVTSGRCRAPAARTHVVPAQRNEES